MQMLSLQHILCWEANVSETSDCGCGRGYGGTHDERFWEKSQGVSHGSSWSTERELDLGTMRCKGCCWCFAVLPV